MLRGTLHFLGIGFTILGLSMNERLMMRLWIIWVHNASLFHMAQVIVEYKKQHKAHLVGLEVSTSWENTSGHWWN